MLEKLSPKKFQALYVIYYVLFIHTYAGMKKSLLCPKGYSLFTCACVCVCVCVWYLEFSLTVSSVGSSPAPNQGSSALWLRTCGNCVYESVCVFVHRKAKQYVSGVFAILFQRLPSVLSFSQIKHTPGSKGGVAWIWKSWLLFLYMDQGKGPWSLCFKVCMSLTLLLFPLTSKQPLISLQTSALRPSLGSLSLLIRGRNAPLKLYLWSLLGSYEL